MIMIIPTTKYGSTYYNTFTMGVFSNYHDFFFQWTYDIRTDLELPFKEPL